jgi:excisionase family DNA binding protein
VARLSGFSQKTVLRAIRAGELPASKVRNEYRVWQSDYREWINAARVTPQASEARARSTGSGIGSAARLREMEAEA